MSTVLVTGGSGFIGSHCILQLLAAGHDVRTTVRSLAREADTRALLRQGGAEPGDKLKFFAANLESDAGWANAVAGCDYVLHVASPFPLAMPKDENELIAPAHDGTLRVLRAARDAGVKRVVMTSSFAAVGYGRKPKDGPFTEFDWTDLTGNVQPYARSKTIAERAAWNFINTEGGLTELSVINPVAVFGPVLGPDYSTSIAIVQRFMDGQLAGVPRLNISVVDVRDVADLHLRAMTSPAAKGERFLAVAGDTMSLMEIAKLLKKRLGKAARRVTTADMPNWMVRLVAWGDAGAKQIVPELGKTRNASNVKAKRLLGWRPRTNEEAIVATAESLVRLGLLRDAAKQKAA